MIRRVKTFFSYGVYISVGEEETDNERITRQQVVKNAMKKNEVGYGGKK